ncbi:hypothetical protein E4U22_001225 [Claviceps purpurea]|uniref:Biotin-protein ligase N-terminal domain-containing protein n=1 Tax=Claviceps purpurea (strain 20.1) TaxID=1111077 RepID=M1WCJ2_CLAP2|nr:hypothetical protein E4U12_005987 [Claviceps purpurea]CCE28894.1 uncharacterized protein CPUR_02584 [Claviceps purpurea 20.1]KAG6138691.1 hypothetical protein E4U38_000324 [Claviceps purpurea]KAG6155858.1 hypothetical protein E4U11_005847 [Claviceps purpurea]KAG6157544.1 hypothetical protein E4U37_007209 [Claviceps purpurea]
MDVPIDAPACRPRALVYRGPAGHGDLSEAVAQLLESSPRRFEVQYAGPKEAVDVTRESLASVELYAQPGGPDLDYAWEQTKSYTPALREFVSRGGRYLGFCLGAYLAGHSPGFGLLPQGADTDSECCQRGAQVKNDKDTIIQVDWNFSTGPHAGKILQDQWVFFQEGAVITDFVDTEDTIVLARYSKSGRVASSLSKYGEGWVGLIGPHPEAPEDWFSSCNIKSPHGLRFEIGYDLIEATMTGGRNVTKCHCDDWPASTHQTKKSRNLFGKMLGRK